LSNKTITFLSDRILQFYQSLSIEGDLPEGVDVMNPYSDDIAMGLCRHFYQKYYGDNRTRTGIFGINPGRFGGGVTGIPFTDPIRLEKDCGIRNDLEKKLELSATFIYEMINAYGGPSLFYGNYFIGAVSPLGFTAEGRNLNYYDDRKLNDLLEPFIIQNLQIQIEIGLTTKACICLGEGKNFKYLSKLNDKHHFFEEIIPLPHPRFIMQYRRKRLSEFIDRYLETLSARR
jgi:hypothetical protein